MDAKRIIHGYLVRQRQGLLAKLDGLSERDVRWPMTPTGTNLLGLVKHVASIELGYFGEVFERPSDIPLPWFDNDAEINADMWATAEESRDEIVTLYQRAAAHADATIEALALDSPGRVPWWPPEREQVTLQQIMVHVTERSPATPVIPTSSASSLMAMPVTMTGTSPIRPHRSGRAIAYDSRRLPRKLRNARKMHHPERPEYHHWRLCISTKCGLCISPRMLPKGSTTEAVTNPASRLITG
jgi:hypothetical protein